MRIRWTNLAESDVTAAAEYIAQDRSGAAEAWTIGVVEAVESLSSFPEMGRIVRELGRSEVRELLFSGYRVIYRIERRHVWILRVFHVRRLLKASDLSHG